MKYGGFLKKTFLNWNGYNWKKYPFEKDAFSIKKDASQEGVITRNMHLQFEKLDFF